MSDSEGDSAGDSGEFSPPTGIDPYAILSIQRTSTAAEIRSAYRRLALSTHPDKVPIAERGSAHTKFQQLAFAYAVLSDEARRARYDATGSTSESAFGGDGEAFDWKAFFRQQVKDLVNPEAVEKFKMEYQGSEEERLAVLDAYTSSKGSLDVIFERVMVSSVLDDEERFHAIIKAAIDAGEVEAYTAFIKESVKSQNQRRKKAEGEAKDAEEYARELGVWDLLFGKKKRNMEGGERKMHSGEAEAGSDENEEEEFTTKAKPNKNGKGRAVRPTTKKAKKDDTSALEALIKSRQQNRQADFLSNIEAKYGAGGSEITKDETRKRSRGRSRGKKATEVVLVEGVEETVELSEQEFQAAKKKVEKNMARKRAKGEEDSGGAGKRRSKRVKAR